MDAEMHVEEVEHGTSQDSTSKSPARKKMRGDIEPAEQLAQSGIEISDNRSMQLQLDPFILWLDQLPVGPGTVLTSVTIQYLAMCRELFEKFERSIQTRPTGTEIKLDEIFDAQVFLRHLVIILDAKDVVKAAPDFTSAPFWLSEFMHYNSASGSREATEKLVEGILESSTLVLSSVSDIMNDLLATYRGPTERSFPGPADTIHQEALIDSFHRPYIGAGARNLRKHIAWVAEGYDPAKNYSRTIPILQSSGSGKTRAVLELGKEELGLFICVRRVAPPDISTSLPAQDELVMKWLAPKGNEERGIAARRMTCWLIAVASTMTIFVRKQRADMFPQPADKPLTDGEWKSLVEHIARLLDPIGENGTVSFEHTRRTTGSERMKLLERIDRLASKRFEECKSKSFAAVIAHAVKAFETLETILPPSGDSFFHLAIDECSQIGEHVHLLRTTWADIAMDRTRCWLLFLDTNTSISSLAGREAYDSSLRLRSMSMPRSFSGLPIDVEIDQDNSTRHDFAAIVRGEKQVTHGELLAYLRKMGRPLLNDSTLLRRLENTGRASADATSINLLPLIQKLVGVKHSADGVPGLWRYSKNDPTAIAIRVGLACHRLPLQILGHTHTSSPHALPEILVGRHMRRLVEVTDSADPFVVTRSPSEPLLSLAAAKAFRSVDPIDAWNDTFHAITVSNRANELLLGETGEEFIRMLLTASIDVAYYKKGLSEFDAVPATAWVKELLQEPPERLLDWSHGCFLNFTHFVVYTKNFSEDEPLSHSDIVEAWIRHAAIIGGNSQQGWDAILPVYTGRPEDLFDPSKVTFIALQTKSGHHSPKSGWARDFVGKTVQTSCTSQNPQGKCSLRMWFALQGATPGVEVAEERRQSTRLPRDPMPPLNVLIVGHDKKVFKLSEKLEPSISENMARYFQFYDHYHSLMDFRGLGNESHEALYGRPDL